MVRRTYIIDSNPIVMYTMEIVEARQCPMSNILNKCSDTKGLFDGVGLIIKGVLNNVAFT